MAFWDGLLGGGSDPLDAYGDLFSKEQKAALQRRSMDEGLLRLAGAFGKAAQPSRMPTSFLGSLGEAAGAMAGQGDQATESALKAMKVGEDVRTSKQQREWTAKLLPSLVAKLAALEKANDLPPGSLTSQIPGPGAATSAAPIGAPSSNAPPWAPPAAPVSMGLPSAGMSPFGLPDAPGAAPAGPPPVLDSPPTPAERLEWSKTVGPGGQYLPIEDWVAQQRAGQKQTGLLPPQDQVVGSGGQPLTGQGVFPSMLASLTGGQAGATLPFRLASSTPTESATPGAAGGDEWLRQNAPFPTAARPQGAGYRWTDTTPDMTALARDPSSYGPGSPFSQPGGGGRAAGRDDPRGVVPYIRERARALGIDPDVAERVARSEGVGTFQSSVIQKDGRREPSWGAFQLYTGGGMGNDFQRDTGLDPADPKNEKATIDYALQKAKTGGWTPWHGAAGAGIGARTGLPGGPSYAEGGQDVVIPSGRGIPASALRNVADTGAVPGGIPGSGSNMPEQLSTLSAITQLLGLKDPFHPMLETYYKSPDYLRQKAITEKTAEKQVGLEYDPKIAAATAEATQKYIQENATHESQLKLANDLIGKGVWYNKETKRMEPITNAAQAMAEISRVQEQNKVDIGLVDTTLTFPGETEPRKVQMTGAQARAVAEGREVKIGGVTIPAMTGIKLGQAVPSAGQTKSEELGVAAGWKSLEETHAAELAANRNSQLYGQLAQAMSGFTPGATAEARVGALKLFRDVGLIKGDEVPSAETFRRAKARLEVAAAPKGQGAASNLEREIFREVIIKMTDTPESIAQAIAIAQRLDDYDRSVAQIHRQVAQDNKGMPNVLEAQKRIAALGPPLSPGEMGALQQIREGGVPRVAPPPPPRPGAGAPPAGPPPPPPPAVGEERRGYRFKGGNPNDQNNWQKVSP